MFVLKGLIMNLTEKLFVRHSNDRKSRYETEMLYYL
jgi:hypothetical protein